MSEARGNVLIAGATGYLGRHVLAAAGQRGYATIALARDARRLADIGPAPTHVIVAEVTRSEQLQGCCDGVNVVFSSLETRPNIPIWPRISSLVLGAGRPQVARSVVLANLPPP